MTDLGKHVIEPVLLTSGMIIGIKTMDKVASTYYCRKCHKRHQKKSKIGKQHKKKKAKKKRKKKRNKK